MDGDNARTELDALIMAKQADDLKASRAELESVK